MNSGRDLMIDGRKVMIDFERERTMPNWVPRRLGGGFGGRKESGQIRFGGKDKPFRVSVEQQHQQLDVEHDRNKRMRRTEAEEEDESKRKR